MSEPINDGGPAFPQTHDSWSGALPPAPPVPSGMSLRDFFAAAALAGVIQARSQAGLDIGQESVAEECYELADALIEQRGKVAHADD